MPGTSPGTKPRTAGSAAPYYGGYYAYDPGYYGGYGDGYYAPAYYAYAPGPAYYGGWRWPPLVASASRAPLAQLVIRVRNSDAFSIDPARDYRSRAGFLIFSGEL